MYRSPEAAVLRGGMPLNSSDGVVGLDQVPCWSDTEQRSSSPYDGDEPSLSYSYFSDPLAASYGDETGAGGVVSRFPVKHEINSKIYLWRGNPWNLEVDAVVNSTNEVKFCYVLLV